MVEKKKTVTTTTNVAGEGYMSPSAKKIAADYQDRKIDHKEAIDRLGGAGKSHEIRMELSKMLGAQSAEKFSAESKLRASNARADKTQTRKPGFSKGGMVKANCGASMKPTQKKAK
jgi:hypothetical protein